MDLRIYLKRENRIPAAPMINDDDDFKECKKGGAAKKVSHASSTGSRSKRSRRQVLKDSDSEDEVAPTVKKSKVESKVGALGKKGPTSSKAPGKIPASSKVPGKSPGGSKAPGKSPASAKTPGKSPATSSRLAKSSKVKGKARPVTTISDFFGSCPIKRTHRQESSKAGKSSSHAPSEVTVIPESPAPEEENVEFEDIAMALIQEEELKQEEQLVHEDEDFSRTLSAAEEVASDTVSTGRKQPIKKLKLMMDKVELTSTKPASPLKQESTPTKKTPSKVTPTKTPIRATANKTPSVATPTKTPSKATPTKTPSKATPTKTPPKATPTKSKDTRVKKATSKATPLATTPTKSTPPKGTRCSPRLMEKQGATPQPPGQSTLKFNRKAKRAIQYLSDADESGDEKPPPKITKQDSVHTDARSRVAESPPFVATPLPSMSPPPVAEQPSGRLSKQPDQPVPPPKQTTPQPHTSSKPISAAHQKEATQTIAKPIPATPPPRPKEAAIQKPFVKPTPSPRQTTPQQDSRRSITPGHSGGRGQPKHDSRCSITPGHSGGRGQPKQDSRCSITPGRSKSSDGGGQPKLPNRENYMKYLNRGGPRNPGSKVIPEGAANCLEGLTFVITGVLDSMEREEAADLIKRYGGKVTGNVSGRTSYLVVGEDAGESKLAKAEKMDTPRIDEDGLLELVKTRPARKGGRGQSAPTSGKGGKKKKSPSVEKKVGGVKRPGSSEPVMGVASEEKPTPSPQTMSFTTAVPVSPAAVAKDGTGREKGSPECLLWVDKYRPDRVGKIVGQNGDNSNAKKLAQWLQNWEANHPSPSSGKKPAKKGAGASHKAALLSGPPGIGKTTTAQLVCKENGFSYVEMNASSCRNKSTIHDQVSAQVHSFSITGFLGSKKGGVASGRRHVLIMDEVDGMDGNADRGGISELISLIKSSTIPILCICNDRQKRSIRSLAGHCYDLPFLRPSVKQICAAVRSICFNERIKIEPQALTEIVTASGQDMRQVLHSLSLWSATDETDASLTVDVAMEAARNAKKHAVMNPFNVVRTVFDPHEGERELSLMEKSDLFFHDYSLSSLFVQENYLRARPHCARGQGSVCRHLRCAALAADSLCDGDILERVIRKDSHWGLLPLQAFLSSVIPGEHMKGSLGRPVFPQWLGMHSKTSRSSRLLQDLQKHSRLSASCNKIEFGMEYLPFLASKVTQPLIAKGAEGVPEVVETMNQYDLQREDWESLSELAHYPGRPELLSQIPTQVKAAFTRNFNKAGHLSHYATSTSAKKRSRSLGEEDGEEDGAGSEEEADSIDKNPMIKALKANGKGGGKGKGKMGGAAGASGHKSAGNKKTKQSNGGKTGRQNNGKNKGKK